MCANLGISSILGVCYHGCVVPYLGVCYPLDIQVFGEWVGISVYFVHAISCFRRLLARYSINSLYIFEMYIKITMTDWDSSNGIGTLLNESHLGVLRAICPRPVTYSHELRKKNKFVFTSN